MSGDVHNLRRRLRILENGAGRVGKMTSTLQERRRYDVGLIVPLQEELRYIVGVAPIVDSFSVDGAFYYVLDFESHSVVCTVVGAMGPLPTLRSTTLLMGVADIRLLVVLGLAGSLDADVLVGDVVVASEVNEFQANAKAESTGVGEFSLRYSGRHYPLEYRIREAIGHFEFSGRTHFQDWQADTQANFDGLTIPNKGQLCLAPARLHLGPMASGNTVAAAEGFVKELKGIDRKFVAIDMEAAGAAIAAFERVHPVPLVVIRGISDSADEQKALLEKNSKGSWRNYCVRNATALLVHLLQWEQFQVSCGLPTSLLHPDPFSTMQELASRLSPKLGGRWLVAVMFDIYSHAVTRNSEGRHTAADISRIEPFDPALQRLLAATASIRGQLEQHPSDLDSAEQGLIAALDLYRSSDESVEASALLSSFDRVSQELIFPAVEDADVRLQLLAADTLEELEGIEALATYLRGLQQRSPLIRERLIDALEQQSLWSEIVELLQGLDAEAISRLELQHAIVACAHTGSEERARHFFHHHQESYEDAAGVLFRRHVSQQFLFLSNQR